MMEHVNDLYVQRAKAEGYRSRAAYKLIEVAARDKLLKPGMRAINVALPKGRCVGGIIRRNDHVDIMLTCKMLPCL